MVVITACLAGFLANNALAQDFQHTDINGNSIQQVEDSTTNANFTLKKSSKIMISSVSAMGGAKGKDVTSKRLEKKMRELGFCCVYQRINENAITANYIITIYPVGVVGIGFNIFDKTLDKNVFNRSYPTFWSANEAFDNFIKDIISSVEE